MSKTKSNRRKFSSAFKSKVALDALRERQTSSELSKKYELHVTQINTWKRTLIKDSPLLFDSKLEPVIDPEKGLESLYCKIGKLEMERDFLKKSLAKLGWEPS